MLPANGLSPRQESWHGNRQRLIFLLVHPAQFRKFGQLKSTTAENRNNWRISYQSHNFSSLPIPLLLPHNAKKSSFLLFCFPRNHGTLRRQRIFSPAFSPAVTWCSAILSLTSGGSLSACEGVTHMNWTVTASDWTSSEKEAEEEPSSVVLSSTHPTCLDVSLEMFSS